MLRPWNKGRSHTAITLSNIPSFLQVSKDYSLVFSITAIRQQKRHQWFSLLDQLCSIVLCSQIFQVDSQYSVTTPAGCESTKEAPGTGHRSTSHSSEGGWGEEEGIREKEKKKRHLLFAWFYSPSCSYLVIYLLHIYHSLKTIFETALKLVNIYLALQNKIFYPSNQGKEWKISITLSVCCTISNSFSSIL